MLQENQTENKPFHWLMLGSCQPSYTAGDHKENKFIWSQFLFPVAKVEDY